MDAVYRKPVHLIVFVFENGIDTVANAIRVPIVYSGEIFQSLLSHDQGNFWDCFEKIFLI